MSRIKKYGTNLNLDRYSTLITDTDPNSFYLKINEFNDVFSGGKNGFVIEGTDHLKESTDVLIEIKDVNGDPVYFEVGDGIPEYYEGLSKVISVHIYEDTPIGEANITILAELKTYVDDNGIRRDVPDDWKGKYNVKWKKRFKINRNIANEDKVRFYYRPTVQIDELVKPIFNVDVPLITQSGSVDGIPEIPIAGIFLDGYAGGTIYKLRVNGGPNWTSSIQDNLITLPDLNYSASVIEVINDTELLVDKPYTVRVGNANAVSSFTNSSYTSSFEFFENETITNSSTLSSFGKFTLRRLGTFVGDVARVKVFRKSRSLLEDFQLVQDIKLESTEFLVDYTASNATEVYYGNFYGTNFDTYWESGSVSHPILLNSTKLLNSIEVDFDPSIGGTQKIVTKDSYTFTKDSEYTLFYKVLYSGTRSDNAYIKTYISSSDYLEQIGTINYSNEYLTKTDIQTNFIPTSTGIGKLVFEIVGELNAAVTNPATWFLSNISLKASQETSFSPDEITFIQQIPRKLFNETFDFRFEFYDINNNYIPVLVQRSKQFTGGNDVAGLAKQLSLSTDTVAFKFDYKNEPSPLVQNDINFTLIRQGYSGSTTYVSSAFDENGTLLSPSSYTGGQYPGLLTNVTDTSATLSITNFTGSRSDVKVSSISYTAIVDGDSSSTTIFRLTDPAPPLVVTLTNTNFVLPANSLGIVQSGITTSTGSVVVYSGNDLVDFEYVVDVSNLSNGKFRYTVTGSGATPSQTVPTINEYGISSLSTETGTLKINVDYRDPNGVLTTTERVVYYAKSRINAPQVALISNPKVQSVSANSSCVQIENFSTVTVIANEFYTGSVRQIQLTTLTSTSQSLTAAPTYNAGLGTINFGTSCLTPSIPSVVLGVTASLYDSEGTLRTVGDNITLNKVKSGTDGEPGDGTGVFYQGDWDNNKIFYHNCIRRDVVSYSSCYWQTNNTSLDACCGYFWCAPSGTNTNWRSFGCTLQSVATDILFSQDVYANRTVNVGTCGGTNIIALDANYPTYCNPRIRLLASGYNTNGIFIGYDSGTPKVSFKSSTNCLLWDGTNLTVSGNITANALAANSIITSPNITGGTICGSTIRIGTAPNSFTADTSGIYLGSGTFASAPFRVCMDGALIASNATISGNITANAVAANTTISAPNITGGTICVGTSISAANIVGGTICANTSISSPNISGGTICANTLISSPNIVGGTICANTSISSPNISGGTICASTSISSPNIVGGTICGANIRISTAAGCFTADSNGIYLGTGAFSTSPFRVCMNGALIATSATISGNITACAVCINGSNYWNSDSSFSLGGSTGICKTAGGSVYIGGSTIIAGTVTATSFCIDGNNYWDSSGLRVAGINGICSDGSSVYIGTNVTVAGNVTANSFCINDSNYWNSSGFNLGGATGIAKSPSGPVVIGSSVCICGTIEASNAIKINSSNYWCSDSSFILGGSSGIAKTTSGPIVIGTSVCICGSISVANSIAVGTGNYWCSNGSFNLGGTTGICYSGSGKILIGSDVCVKGILEATSGQIGGWTIGATSLTSTVGGITTTINSSTGAVTAGSGFGSSGFQLSPSGFYWYGSGGSNNYIDVTTGGANMSSGNAGFFADSSGGAAVRAGTFFSVCSGGSGKVCASGGLELYGGSGISITGGSSIFINGGNICISGVGCATNWIAVSDMRLKDNIKRICYGLCDIMKLKPVTYTMKSDCTNSNRIGFIAQQVKPIIPEIVVGDCMLGINYSVMVSVLTNAIQQQQCQIEDLKNKIYHLMGCN